MAKFDIDEDAIRRLAAILEETGLTEIEYQQGDAALRVSRGATAAASYAAPAPTPAQAGGIATAALVAADDAKHPGAVASPMVGTAYLSPEPGKPAFVKVGDAVTAGQTLLIIEAMKTFNPIRAPKPGKVSKIMISDGQPVEFAEALMIVE